MIRSPTTRSMPDGRARKAVTAFLLAAMFLVPMTPMGDAALTSGSFNVEVVSGSNTLGEPHYNFTFKTTGGNDRAFRVDFPTTWETHGGSALGATAGDTSFTGVAKEGSGARFFNFTSSSDFKTGTTENYINVTGITPPRAEGSYTLTTTIFNSTGAPNGTPQTDTVAVSATTLTIDLDDDHEDDMIFGSGAVTDYWFKVTGKTGYLGTDSINITFPSGFDLSDASGTDVVISGQQAGYDIQTNAEAASTFVIHVKDVKNPTVTANEEFDISAILRSSTGGTVATGSFDIDLVPTAIVVSHTGSNTVITEGEEEDDAVNVRLQTKPAEDVEVTIHPGDQIVSDEAKLTFTPSNWDTVQKFTLTAVDDDVAEGTTVETIRFTSSSDDANYDDLEATLAVNVADNDIGIVLRHTDGKTQVIEGDSVGDTYQVVLSTRPTSTVTVDITPHSNLDVDKTELTFTNTNTNNWNVPQTVTVTSARLDDSKYQKPVDYTILHTSESTDTNYDDLEAELTVTLKDDEHAALGLTAAQIRDANKLVEVTLTEQSDGILVEWELPNQEELDKIFDSDGEIKIEGVQVLHSKSPYTLAATYDRDDSAFADKQWEHDFDDGATSRTKYIVTMFYAEDVGKWTTDNVPDTRDDGYGGERLKDPFLPWWGWLLIGIGGLILIALILVAVMASQNRRFARGADWDDDSVDEEEAVAATAAAPAKQKYDLECPVCDHQFTAKGTKPLKTECPSCGAKGVLN